ncbi:MAG: ATP-dependent helicase, partial [Chloroflexi bacterium]|nr:ATP-dependent helicase [Chloroflexota bacterium]
MGLPESRQKLRSQAPKVLIEAPAGFGKTYESVAAARDLSETLEEGQKVLLLAHTNTAVQTFRSRLSHLGKKFEAMTLDSFAFANVAPYARELGLPVPLRVGKNAVEFPVLAKKLNELYNRSNTIARATADRYPVIILDEHQDARREQHSFVSALAYAGNSRLLVFGDPMQAIFDFDPKEAIVKWPDLTKEATVTDELTDPHRWQEAPELGDWIKEARKELMNGGKPIWSEAPKAVDVRRLPELDDMQQFSPIPPYKIAGVLNSLLNHCQGSVALLTKTNHNVTGLLRAVKHRLRLNEGAEFKAAYDILPDVVEAAGNPVAMSGHVLRLLRATGTGCTKDFSARVKKRLKPEGVNLKASGKLQPFLETLQRVYEEPSLETWCSVVDQVRRKPPEGIGIEQPDCLHVLAALGGDEQDPLLALDNVCRERRSTLPQHRATVSTIHKVKGQEYDNIILCHFSARPFPDDEEARKLLYVALSRA